MSVMVFEWPVKRRTTLSMSVSITTTWKLSNDTANIQLYNVTTTIATVQGQHRSAHSSLKSTQSIHSSLRSTQSCTQQSEVNIELYIAVSGQHRAVHSSLKSTQSCRQQSEVNIELYTAVSGQHRAVHSSLKSTQSCRQQPEVNINANHRWMKRSL